MVRFFAAVIRPLLEVIAARRVIEIGAAAGDHSKLLSQWCRENRARLWVIDTAPRFDAMAFEAEFRGVTTIHKGESLNVLPELPSADMVLIDGDHNWHTVFHELETIRRRATGEGRQFPVCVFHDTGWPYGRRDLYYDPGRVPGSARHPTKRGPLLPHVGGIAEYGLNPHLTHAEQEGGERNGVLTAIEDFLAGSPEEFALTHLPILFGLSVLTPEALIRSNSDLQLLIRDLSPGERWNSLLATVEAERCYGTAAMHRLMPLPLPPDLPSAGDVAGRTFSSSVPAEALSGIQQGVLRQTYRGRAFYKSPFDLSLYRQLFEKLRPQTVIEIGTADGGGALWFADTMSGLGIAGRVVTIDRQGPPPGFSDARITTLVGEGQTLEDVLSATLLAALPKPWVVVEDSAHVYEVSRAVLEFFDRYLAPGDYLVVEDGIVRSLPGEQYRKYCDGPSRAIETFLRDRGANYAIDTALCDHFGYNVTYNPNAWLRRTGETRIPEPIGFYHDFRNLGLHNVQLPGIFAANQSAKAPTLSAYLLFAIAKLKNRGVRPISFAELFCADAYYAQFARRFGADRSTGFDSNKDGFLDQARAANALLGSDVELVATTVEGIPPDRRFSIVANIGGLYHVDDPAAVLLQSARMAEHYLIVQNVVSLATSSPEYFERPAPGWTWGNRFSRQSFDALIGRLGFAVVDTEFNVLTGNDRPEDRGSVYYLIDVTSRYNPG
jgi:cephalosporin hydroxylase